MSLWFVYDTEYPDEGSHLIEARDTEEARIIGARALGVDSWDKEHLHVQPCDPHALLAQINDLKRQLADQQEILTRKALVNADLLLERTNLQFERDALSQKVQTLQQLLKVTEEEDSRKHDVIIAAAETLSVSGITQKPGEGFVQYCARLVLDLSLLHGDDDEL